MHFYHWPYVLFHIVILIKSYDPDMLLDQLLLRELFSCFQIFRFIKLYYNKIK